MLDFLRLRNVGADGRELCRHSNTVKDNEMATYNGWTNYATWRVNLEIFDGSEGPWDHHSAKEFAEELIYSSTSAGIGRDYALAFLSDVNWYEIADHYQDENAQA